MKKKLFYSKNAAKTKPIILTFLILLNLSFFYRQSVKAQVDHSMGIISIDKKLVDVTVLADNEWVGGWHYSTEDIIIGTGDFDDDGQDDFIITSDWGIGILTLDGSAWRMIFSKPNGTSFGDWVFDSQHNIIQGIGDFDGDGKDDILITSDWGIGILSLDKKNRLKSLMAKPNSSRFGGWNFDSKNNTIHGIGDFNGDGKEDILITSDWGIGILTLKNNLKSLITKPNSSRFGGWNFDSKNNTIHGIGDFDGDKKDDIFISNDWGIGILILEKKKLISLIVKSNGTRLGNWIIDSQDNTIQGFGDINGDEKTDIVITNNLGIGILNYNTKRNRLESMMVKPNGTLFGEWNFNSQIDLIQGIGDLNDDDYDEIIIQSEWGLGLLEWVNSGLQPIQIIPNEELFGNWVVEKTDKIIGIGNFNSRKGLDILIQKSKPYKLIEYFQPNIRNGGRAISIAVNPEDDKQIIVASETGGLFKTLDGGKTWKHLDNLKSFFVTDVKYLDCDPNIVIATAWADFKKTNNGCIWRSTNGGETWLQPPTGIPPPSERCDDKISAYSIAFDIKKKRLYVGTDCGLAISNDLGETWKHTTTAIIKKIMNTNYKDRVWSVIAPDKNRVYLTSDSGIWYSKNGGRSLLKSKTDLIGQKTTYHALAASPYNADHVFLVTDNNRLLCTNNGGIDWDQFQRRPDIINRVAFVRIAKSISGNPREFDLYYGDGKYIFRMTFKDHNNNFNLVINKWTKLKSDHADPADIAFDNNNQFPILLATDGGVHTTKNQGLNWTLNGGGKNGFNALQITEVTGQRVTGTNPHTNLYFGTQDNHIWSSSNGGVTWPNDICCEGYYLQIERESQDHSTSKIVGVRQAPCENFIADPQLNNKILFPNPTDPDTNNDETDGSPIFLKPDHYLYKTIDTLTSEVWFHLTRNTGANWTQHFQIKEPLTAELPHITGSTTNPTLYQPVYRDGNFCGDLDVRKIGLKKINNLYNKPTLSDADGLGFTSLGIFPTMFVWHVPFGVDPVNSNFLIIPDIGKKVMQISIDGGLTWHPDMDLTKLVTDNGKYEFCISTPSHKEKDISLINNIAFDPDNHNHILIGTAQNGIIRSDNGGRSWKKIAGTESITNISSFYFQDETHVVVSSYGRGLWKLRLPKLPTPLSVPNYQNISHSDQSLNYPDLVLDPFDTNICLDEPLIIDPTTGTFLRYRNYTKTNINSGYEHFIAKEGYISDVKLSGLKVEEISILGSNDAIQSVIKTQKELLSMKKQKKTFSRNPVIENILKNKLPIKGLILDEMNLKGIICYTGDLPTEIPSEPYVNLTAQYNIGSIPAISPGEEIRFYGENFVPSSVANNPVIVTLENRELLQINVDKAGTFKAHLRINKMPGDYTIEFTQKDGDRLIHYKSNFKIIVNDVSNL